MANTRCIACPKYLSPSSLQCRECGYQLYCSVQCALFSSHPCHALRDFPSCPKYTLTTREKYLIGSFLYLHPSPVCLEALLRAHIPGPAFECLFQIAGVFELWPHMAENRAIWVGKMATLLKDFIQLDHIDTLPTFKYWSSVPSRYILLFTPFLRLKNQADAIMETIDTNELWRFVFGNDLLYDFLLTLLKHISLPASAKFQSTLKHLRIRRGGKGLDLIMFGKFIHLPLSAQTYEEAKSLARTIRLPSNLYFIHDRQRWAVARKVYIGWCLRRELLALQIGVTLDRKDLFDWTVWHNTHL